MKTFASALALAAVLVGANAQGFVRSEHRTRVIKSTPPHEIYSKADIPKSYDVRETLHAMGSQISTARNQHIPHYCGSCWSFATASMLSDRLRLQQNGSWPQITLGPQSILDCDQHLGDQGCYGGDPITALEYIHKNNITSETNAIYRAQGWYKTGRECTAESYAYTCSPGAGCAPVDTYQAYHVEEYGEVNGSHAMMAEILANGPIACGVAVTEAFENYRGDGVFIDQTDSTTIEHSISVLGWGEEQNKDGSTTPYWIMRNSWGTWWGLDRGFAKVLRSSPENPTNKGGLCIECDCQWGKPAPHTPPVPAPNGKPQPGPGMQLRMHSKVADGEKPRKYADASMPCKKTSKGPKPSHVVSPLPHTYLSPEDLPKIYDPRAMDGVDYTTRNKQQHAPQYCGSCWAQGSTSALSDRINMALKAPSVAQINLAVQPILNCQAGGSCEGGEPEGVYQWMRENGLPDQTCQQYIAQDPKRASCDPIQICETCSPSNSSFSPGSCAVVKKYPAWRVKEFGQVSGVDQIKAELVARGPIGAGMMVTAKFEEYAGGIYKEQTGPIEINHEISLVGYGETTDGEQYFIGRNSWGTAWGSEGWFYITTDESMNLGITTEGDWATPELTEEHFAAFRG